MVFHGFALFFHRLFYHVYLQPVGRLNDWKRKFGRKVVIILIVQPFFLASPGDNSASYRARVYSGERGAT